MRPDVLIRADASTAIATGHIYRTLVLAKQISAVGLSVAYAVRRFSGDLVARIAACGYPILDLGPADPKISTWLGVPLDIEICRFREAIKSLQSPPRWIIVDHYELDERWEACAAEMGPSLFVIDDLSDRPHVCDVLMDPTLGPPERYASLTQPKTRLLLGPKYAPLRDAFTAERRKGRVRDGHINRILVFFGSVDLTGQTAKALRAMRAVNADLEIDVVLGSDNPQRQEIQREARRDSRVTIRSGDDEMASLTASADLVLGAGGSACWERCMVGAPAIIIMTANNQEKIVGALAEAGAVKCIGASGSVDETDLKNVVQYLMNHPDEVAQMGRKAHALMAEHALAQKEIIGIINERGVEAVQSH